MSTLLANSSTPSAQWDDRICLARACRVMAYRGLVEDVLGHLSMRVGPDRLLLRCRGPHEAGLRFTVPADIRLVDLSGTIVDGGGAQGYSVPTEAPIHTETLRRHPHVGAVLHVHPPAVVVASLTQSPLVAMFGSYDIPAARLAAGGIPRYGRSVLIRRAELASEMLDVMGDRPVCVLDGHGLVTTGATVSQAMLRALAVDRLARTAMAVLTAGGRLQAIPQADLDELPDLGPGLNTEAAWRFHLASLAADGWDLSPADLTSVEAPSS